MARSKSIRRGVGKLSDSGGLGVAGLVLLLGSGPSWAGPPNPTASDSAANTAGGTSVLINNTTGIVNTALGAWALGTKNRGNYNTAVGFGADIAEGVGHVENSTALGNQAKISASNSIVLGNGKITKIYAHVTAISSISDRRRKKDIR